MNTTSACATSRILSPSALLLSTLLAACSSQPEPQVPEAPPPQIDAEEAVYVPGPSADEIRTAIEQKNTALRQCYMMGTFRDSQLTGTVSVIFTIDTTGKVSEANDAGSNMPDPEVVECVLGVFAQLEFRAGASSATEVTYPITFGG